MDDLSCQRAALLIDGLVDGELKDADIAVLQHHLDGCDGCRQRLAERRRLVAMIAAALPRPATDAVLRQRMLRSLPKPARPARPWWLAAPAALAASLMLYLALPSANNDALLSLHLRSLTPGHLTDVESSDRHTVKPWFNGKLDISPPVPDLKERQFPLLGGRLDYIGGQKAACLVYGRQLHIINLCLWRDGTKLPAIDHRQGFTILSWQQDGQQIAVISDLNETELGEFKQLWIANSH